MHSWKDDMKVGLKETEWEGMDWINLAQDKNPAQRRTLMTAVMNLQVPYIAGFFYENKTNQCVRKYANLLHYSRRRSPKCFGHLLWPSSGWWLFEWYITSDKNTDKLLSVIYPSNNHLPEDGHNRWPKHVGGLRRPHCNKFGYLQMQLLVLLSQWIISARSWII